LFPSTELVVNQLLIVDPKNIKGLQLKGLIEYKKGNYQDSISYVNKVIKLDPDNSENYNNIALAYLHSGQQLKAFECCSKALELNDNNFNYICNLALILRSLNKNEDALKYYNKALSLDSNNPMVWESIGSIYGQEKKYDLAIECFLKAIEKNSSFLDSRIDLAYAYHLTGQWEKAWNEYEYRIPYWREQGRGPGAFLNFYKAEKAWNGKDDLNNKVVVVFCEQGHGDLIQFLRFIPELKAKGCKVIVETSENTFSIVNKFADEVRTYFNTVEYDYHCSILSLPYLLNLKTPDKFKSDKPYILVDEIYDMSNYKDTFNIGICWAGNPGHPNDALRSCHLSNFRELSKIPKVKLFSLQKDLSKRIYANMPNLEIDLADNCQDLNIVDTSELMSDFESTAKLIKSLDLVITVDTSVLHLSGAVGAKTFGLIALNPDWRWTSQGSTNVWYDSVELIRQKDFNNWDSVFEEICDKVRKLINE
jgi:tetratricopeptide (TPR) repeat protein